MAEVGLEMTGHGTGTVVSPS